MKIARLLISKTVLTTLVIIAALIAYNSFNTNLESEQLASFNEWYPTTALALESQDSQGAGKIKLRISIRTSGTLSASASTFPATSLIDATERERTSRVLQLISESKVFGLPSVSREKDGEGYITIAVSDDSASFSTTVSNKAIDGNIQLQNLLKLLEVYASIPTQQVNPALL